jgi:hypothetical protein
MLRRILFPALVLAASLVLPSAANATVIYTFYNCEDSIPCTGPREVIAQFSTLQVIVAPSAPPPGTYSTPAVIAADKVQGEWDTLTIFSFNIAGNIGSAFRFDNFSAANGKDYGDLAEIGPVFGNLRLNWPDGTYLAMGITECLNAECTISTDVIDGVKLVVETVPEPSSVALVGLPVAFALWRRRRLA